MAVQRGSGRCRFFTPPGTGPGSIDRALNVRKLPDFHGNRHGLKHRFPPRHGNLGTVTRTTPLRGVLLRV